MHENVFGVGRKFFLSFVGARRLSLLAEGGVMPSGIFLGITQSVGLALVTVVVSS